MTKLEMDDSKIFDNLLLTSFGIKPEDLLYEWETDVFKVIRYIEEDGLPIDVDKVNAMGNNVSLVLKTDFDILLKNIRPDNKVYTNIDQFSMVSGKLRTSNYNFMDMPWEFRCLFNPPENMQFVTFHFPFLRLYILAHLSEDPDLLSMLLSPSTVYKNIAHRIFSKFNDSESAMDAAVVMNSFILGNSSDCTGILLANKISDIKPVMTKFEAAFPKIIEFKEMIVREGLKSGYINSHFGRQWHIDHTLSDLPGTIFNYVIQATAQDIIHSLISYAFRKGLKINMLAHDGIVCTVPMEFDLMGHSIVFDGLTPNLTVQQGWVDEDTFDA